MRHAAGPGVAVTVLLVAALAGPAPARAWSNGGGDGFGTHDWILAESARVAREQGHDWVDLRVALPMTDDPDTRLHDTYYHIYQVGGRRYGGSPTKVASLYAQAVAQLRAGDRLGASRSVGLLAHYFGDTNNPLHTDQTKAEERIHGRYELAVEKHTDAPGENGAWLGPMRFTRVRDPAALTVGDAMLAHRSYSALVAEFSARGYDARVEAITRQSLNRAVGGLADILGSIQLDAGYRVAGAKAGTEATAAAVASATAGSRAPPAPEATGSGDVATSVAAVTPPSPQPEASPAPGAESPQSGTTLVQGLAGACCALLLVALGVGLGLRMLRSGR